MNSRLFDITRGTCVCKKILTELLGVPNVPLVAPGGHRGIFAIFFFASTVASFGDYGTNRMLSPLESDGAGPIRPFYYNRHRTLILGSEIMSSSIFYYKIYISESRMDDHKLSER